MGCPLCGSKRGGGGRGGGCGIVPTGPLGRITVCICLVLKDFVLEDLDYSEMVGYFGLYLEVDVANLVLL